MVCSGASLVSMWPAFGIMTRRGAGNPCRQPFPIQRWAAPGPYLRASPARAIFKRVSLR